MPNGLPRLLAAAARAGLLDAAHDLSDGGLAIALAECCLAGGHGCRVSLPGDAFTFLFSESAARVVVAVEPGSEADVRRPVRGARRARRATGHGRGRRLEVEGCFAVPLDELAAAHQGALPALFG